jgi:uncharacterized membrane protein
MTGVIWYVQVVHYPLMSRVDRTGFAAFEAAHRRLTSFVVVPAMLVELAAALALIALRPATLPSSVAWAGIVLLGLIWFSTFTLQVPCHNILLRGYRADVHARLVRTNWIRTVGWTTRAAVALWMIADI